jgi:hypothetical protein
MVTPLWRKSPIDVKLCNRTPPRDPLSSATGRSPAMETVVAEAMVEAMVEACFATSEEAET